MAEVTPTGAKSCQGSRAATRMGRFVWFVFELGLILASASCTTEEQKPVDKPKEPQPTAEPPAPERKPIETRRLHLAEPKVDRRVYGEKEAAPRGLVEIRTWADEVIRGNLVDETPDSYLVEVTGKDGQPTVRRVHRSAVMSLTKVRQRP